MAGSLTLQPLILNLTAIEFMMWEKHRSNIVWEAGHAQFLRELRHAFGDEVEQITDRISATRGVTIQQRDCQVVPCAGIPAAGG